MPAFFMSAIYPSFNITFILFPVMSFTCGLRCLPVRGRYSGGQTGYNAAFSGGQRYDSAYKFSAGTCPQYPSGGFRC